MNLTKEKGIILVALLIITFAQRSIVLAESFFQKNDLVGKWASLIKTDGDVTSNIIYLQLDFRKNGTVIYKGDGIIFDEEKAALFTIEELKHWDLNKNNLSEKQIECTLTKITGDPNLISHAKDFYRNFKNDRKDSYWERQVLDVTPHLMKLEFRDDKGRKQLQIYHKIK